MQWRWIGSGSCSGELVIEVSAAGYRELERWAAGLAVDGRQLVFGIDGPAAMAPAFASTSST